jgi:hypothetical protein
MVKPRVRIATDGRIGFPDIVRYRTRDGKVHSVPPRDGARYAIDILNVKAYEELRAAGRLGLGHEYLKQPTRINNRKTA